MSLRLSLSFALNSERSGRKRTKTRTLLPFLNGAITNRTMEHTDGFNVGKTSWPLVSNQEPKMPLEPKWPIRYSPQFLAVWATQAAQKKSIRGVYCKIAKKYPRGLHFSKALFEGLIYIGKFAFQDRLGWPYIWKEIYPFLICFTLYLKASSKYKPPGSLYLAGQFNRGFFALRVWGAYIWRGLFTEFYGISNKYILTIIMYLFIYFSWLIYDWNLNRTKDSLEVQMLQQHNLFYYGVLTLSLLTSRQPREEFQCLYENLMSDGFRKTAVLKKILFSLLEWDFKENDNRRQTFISKFIFQFSVELGFLGFHVNVKNFNRNY